MKYDHSNKYNEKVLNLLRDRLLKIKITLININQ